MEPYKLNVKVQNNLLVTTETGEWDEIKSEGLKTSRLLTSNGFAYSSYRSANGVVKCEWKCQKV